MRPPTMIKNGYIKCMIRNSLEKSLGYCFGKIVSTVCVASPEIKKKRSRLRENI